MATVLLLLLYSLFTVAQSCIDSERLALLAVKNTLTDPLSELASWTGRDCCTWTGIICHNSTLHVSTLQLSGLSLGGPISPSLAKLDRITSLDLSFNDFGGTAIPPFLGSITSLTNLNLSSSNFGGPIPRQLGNLTRLRRLDLSSDEIISFPGLNSDSLAWVTTLTNLRYLRLGTVNLMNAADWFTSINKLPSLSVLRLAACQIDQIPDTLPSFNLTLLSILDLSTNNLNSSLPQWLSNASAHLASLDLSGNSFSGPIPDTFGNMTSLSVLKLKLNQLSGEIPATMGNLCMLQSLVLAWNGLSGEVTGLVDMLARCNSNLTELDLSHNSLTGPVPPSLERLGSLKILFLQYNMLTGTVPVGIGRMSELVELDVSSNLLVGDVSEAHFAELGKLKELYLSRNKLSLKVSPSWVPPFQLNFIYLPSVQQGPQFPPWLRTQIGFSKLDISDAGISGTLPSWLWGLTSELIYFNLSHNQLEGRLPASLESISIELMDLSNNKFDGPLPRFNPDILVLILFGNTFSGSLPPDIALALPVLRNLLLSSNLIEGTIPDSICDMMSLEVLGLADNRLTGEIPHCWNGTQGVVILDLGNNNLSGRIPERLGTVETLRSLHLNNNSLTGIIPDTLKNCSDLVAIDVGENSLDGSIPTWLGESLPNLVLLRLRSNGFTGYIRPELSLLASLQLLDVANNHLTGIIPKSLGGLSAMMSQHDLGDLLHDIWGLYEDTMLVYVKGRELKYSTTLALVTSIDLSSNELTGGIPGEITNLSGLISFNLSDNRLTGEIPRTVGNLRLLESLDLSRNKLSGTIPPSISSLNYLSRLNLSYNDLRGRIPSGLQLQALDDPSSIYVGNEGLCGPPLEISCISPSTEVGDGGDGDDSGRTELIWFYCSIAPGFAAGVLGFLGVFLYKAKWRYALFSMIDWMDDWVYLKVASMRGKGISSDSPMRILSSKEELSTAHLSRHQQSTEESYSGGRQSTEELTSGGRQSSMSTVDVPSTDSRWRRVGTL